MIADDSPLYRKLLHDTLAREHYRVLVAENGSRALELVTQVHPEVLITDWDMPDMSGTELCARLHSDLGSYVHSILLTSHDDKEQVVKGLAAGAHDYLTKPFHEGELLARVEVGIRIAELNRELQTKNRLLEELALTDALTGLANRRAFENWASRAFSATIRHGVPLWLAIADLDHFKLINDTHGHEAGDEVLRRFGNILKAHTRAADMCARLGGEEFVLALGHIDRAGAEVALNRFRERIENGNFDWNGVVLRVTASIGVACAHEGVQDLTELLRRADAALYAAKESGRNTVKFA